MILAILTRQVFVSLFAGIWLGASILSGFNPFTGFLRVLDKFFLESLGDKDHAAVVLFSMSLGGMVRVMAATGGLHALVLRAASWARTVRLGQISTWLMGILIFFDDYANTLLVGNTMRPFTDKLRISREKLAYLVDSTDAPVASLFPISTWIGYEVLLLRSQLEKIGQGDTAYRVFLESIPYRFYGILAVLFVLFVASWNRDFGPMLKAERRARKTGRVLGENARPLVDREITEETPAGASDSHWFYAVAPIAAVVAVMILGIYFSGIQGLKAAGEWKESVSLWRIIEKARTFHALLWASFSGSALAIVLSLRRLSLTEAMESYFTGLRAMVLAMVVLVLAWAIGSVCEELKTAEWCGGIAGKVISPYWVPVVIFVTSAFVSFATGSSWTTMAILIPIALRLAWKFPAEGGADPSSPFFLAVVGGVLSGATFGDHCSPISDTTIMSSMASACDHIDHTKTQMVYAISVAAVAIFFGYIPVGLGLPVIIVLPLGIAATIALVYFVGKPVPNAEDFQEATAE